MLDPTDGPLCDRHDLVMLDLDGVVYVGGDAVPGAPEHLARVRGSGVRCAFVTNNASRPPAVVADHLTRLGVQAAPEDVVTSAQAAARLLHRRFAAGSPVAVLGAPALEEEVRSAGLEPVGVDDDDAVALVTGYGPEVLWREVMRAAVRVRDGLPWVASNTDGSIPTPYGTAPGHGVLVETIQRFAGRDPEVAGKPAPPLLEETIERAGATRPLMVGDRLDTDIAGGAAVGVPTLLVMTGVTGVAELVAAEPAERPTHLAADLGGLLEEHPRVVDGASGGWRARVDGERLVVEGGGGADDWWRVVASAAWRHRDDGGAVPDTVHLDPPQPRAAGAPG
ncbi:HAD-IIA family hydrolase [Nocardioides nanhaiensis]|uniref:HAD hydrolase-like protein n=1 Tax=Nocardioides nanhaiensis TaxID=1476871 RepID=A0ABP8WQY8_9ACTN